jgi:hypothetical protein
VFALKYRWIVGRFLISIFWITGACTLIPLHDTTSPTIQNVTTSSKVIAKSDCINTSLTITANITDDTKVDGAALWYRVGTDQKFTSTKMIAGDRNQYTGTIVALDVPGGEYGILEFYILARDKTGNETKSPVDRSVQLLPCVAS